jgi:hypothetical protein
MGRYVTSPWILIDVGGPGRTDFSFIPPILDDYRLRGIRIQGYSQGINWTLITGGPRAVKGGGFGFPFELIFFPRYTGSFRLDVGFAPLWNSFAVFFGFAPLILPNQIRINPVFRKSTNWSVYRGGKSGNLDYSFYIRYRVWKPIKPEDRGPLFKWWYGIE